MTVMKNVSWTQQEYWDSDPMLAHWTQATWTDNVWWSLCECVSALVQVTHVWTKWTDLSDGSTGQRKLETFDGTIILNKRK